MEEQREPRKPNLCVTNLSAGARGGGARDEGGTTDVDLYVKLRNKEGLTEAEGSVASYLTANPDAINTLSIRKLAEYACASTATISRMCKRLKFRGYRDFRIRFYQDYLVFMRGTRQVSFDTPFAPDDTPMSIVSKIGSLTKNTITECQAFVDHGATGRAVELLGRSDNIVGVGVADSFVRLIDFQNKMLKIGKSVRITILQSEQIFLCTQATPADCGLLVSYTGKTAETLNEARILAGRGIPTVAITSGADSPLAQIVDVPILLPGIEDAAGAAYTLASQIALEYVLNVLFSIIYSQSFDEARRHLRQSKSLYLHRNLEDA